MRISKRLTGLLLALTLCLPGAALAQSGGNDEYCDPFDGCEEGTGGSGGGNSGGGGSGSGNSGSGSGSSGSGTAGTSAAGAEPAQAGSDGSGTLPLTGFPLAGMVFVATAMMSGGYILRRSA